MLTNITSIKNHRIFLNFRWKAEMKDFGRYNLIYGGNGTGKTTLSNLLRAIEKGIAFTEGEFTFNFDGGRVSSKNLAAGLLPTLRVFNEDFIKDNVFTVSGSVSPIFVVGESSVSAQKQVEILKQQYVDSLVERKTLTEQVRIREASVEDYCKEIAKGIKLLLNSSGQNPFNFYTKRNYDKTADRLGENYTAFLMEENEKKRLKTLISGSPKDLVNPIQSKLPDPGFFHGQTSEIAQSISELEKDPSLAKWVQEGMRQHSVHQNTGICLFCGQTIPAERLRRLEDHFNRQHTALLEEINQLAELIQNQIEELGFFHVPDKAALANHLLGSYDQATKELKLEVASVKTILKELHKALREKVGKVFESVLLPPYASQVIQSDALARVNAVIEQHNREARDYQSTVTAARERLEEAMVAESIESYRKRKRNCTEAKKRLTDCEQVIIKLKDRIDRIEMDIISHRRSAGEFNRDLQLFLGHDTLRLETQESGYKIMRKDEVATALSQGERTVISFL